MRRRQFLQMIVAGLAGKWIVPEECAAAPIVFEHEGKECQVDWIDWLRNGPERVKKYMYYRHGLVVEPDTCERIWFEAKSMLPTQMVEVSGRDRVTGSPKRVNVAAARFWDR